MSKSFADIAKLLSPTNNQLFDRYINVRLATENTDTPGPNDIIFKTPLTGQKPNITVSGTMNAGDVINNFTVTVYNIDSSIDFNLYGYIEVEAGYLKSGFAAKFRGMVTNCYMAKPNPNGELVISGATADMGLIATQSNIEVKFTQGFVTVDQLAVDFCVAISNATGKVLTVDTTNIPSVWKGQRFSVGKHTYHFHSCMEALNWLNNTFLACSRSAKFESDRGAGSKTIGASAAGALDASSLPPLCMYFSSQDPTKLIVQGMYTNAEAVPVLKSLANISNAYIIGEAATVSAPWNPQITVNDYIFVDTKYFKTRVNVTAKQFFSNYLKSLSCFWKVNQVQFTFSTFTTNNATYQIINLKNKIGEE